MFYPCKKVFCTGFSLCGICHCKCVQNHLRSNRLFGILCAREQHTEDRITGDKTSAGTRSSTLARLNEEEDCDHHVAISFQRVLRRHARKRVFCVPPRLEQQTGMSAAVRLVSRSVFRLSLVQRELTISLSASTEAFLHFPCEEEPLCLLR